MQSGILNRVKLLTGIVRCVASIDVPAAMQVHIARIYKAARYIKISVPRSTIRRGQHTTYHSRYLIRGGERFLGLGSRELPQLLEILEVDARLPRITKSYIVGPRELPLFA